MSMNAEAYLKVAYPPPLQPPHLSDEDIAAQLEQSAKRSRAAHKAQERKRQRRAEQGAASEEEGAHE